VPQQVGRPHYLTARKKKTQHFAILSTVKIFFLLFFPENFKIKNKVEPSEK
jgi:hypothetical protein